MKESYVMAAFVVDSPNSIKYQKYRSLRGLAEGVLDALEMKADYISIRRIREP